MKFMGCMGVENKFDSFDKCHEKCLKDMNKIGKSKEDFLCDMYFIYQSVRVTRKQTTKSLVDGLDLNGYIYKPRIRTQKGY